MVWKDVSLRCYLETLNSPCKVSQLQRWEKNRVKNCLSSTKPNTCWTKNSWSSGIMSNFLGQFFYVLGGKKNSKKFFRYYSITSGIVTSTWSLYTTSLFSFGLWCEFFCKSTKAKKSSLVMCQNSFKMAILESSWKGKKSM